VAPEQEPAASGPEVALAVAPKPQPPPPRDSRTKLKPVDLPQDAEFTGEVLRRVREQRGFSLSQLAERTRISTRHLENVEADEYDELPATVYLRGILMNIARELGLDPLKVSRSYLALAAGASTNKKR
jgi:ribosome-binding protein aMBF1 (putative translation factor)